MGSEKITVGELNAEVAKLRERVGPERWSRLNEGDLREVKGQVLELLIDTRLIQLAARNRGIAVSDTEIRARMDQERAQFAQGFAQQRQQGFDQLAAGATQQLRPLVNARGGSGLPNDELSALVRAEVERMQGAIEGRGQVVTRAVPGSVVEDRAASLSAALAGKGVTISAAELEPTLRAVADQLAGANSSQDDGFERDLLDNGVASGNAYRDRARDTVLGEKLRPLYAPGQVTAVTVQQLVTDRPERAREALEKARGGMAFNEVVQQYAGENFRDNQLINAGTGIVETFSPGVRELFPQLQEGAYSELQTVPPSAQDPKTYYRFFYITRVERRAPTPDDLGALRQQWVQGLRATYSVTISPDLGLPATAAR